MGNLVATVGTRSLCPGRDHRLPRLAGEGLFVNRFGRRKGGLAPIQECEKDTTGGFTNGGPGDSQVRLTGSLCLSFCYGQIFGSAVPIGEIGSGRDRPPYFASRIGTAASVNFTRARTAGEGRSRPNNPCGKAQRQAWMARTTEVGARHGNSALRYRTIRGWRRKHSPEAFVDRNRQVNAVASSVVCNDSLRSSSLHIS